MSSASESWSQLVADSLPTMKIGTRLKAIRRLPNLPHPAGAEFLDEDVLPQTSSGGRFGTKQSCELSEWNWAWLGLC